MVAAVQQTKSAIFSWHNLDSQCSSSANMKRFRKMTTLALMIADDMGAAIVDGMNEQTHLGLVADTGVVAGQMAGLGGK